jgi:hypothetical protein
MALTTASVRVCLRAATRNHCRIGCAQAGQVTHKPAASLAASVVKGQSNRMNDFAAGIGDLQCRICGHIGARTSNLPPRGRLHGDSYPLDPHFRRHKPSLTRAKWRLRPGSSVLRLPGRLGLPADGILRSIAAISRYITAGFFKGKP